MFSQQDELMMRKNIFHQFLSIGYFHNTAVTAVSSRILGISFKRNIQTINQSVNFSVIEVAILLRMPG